MTSRNVVLHIGMYKTGTTALQMYLKSTRDSLLEKSILYPLTGLPARESISFGHHDLATGAAKFARQTGEPVTIFEELRREIDASAARTVILSSEMFCSLTNPRVLRRYFDEDNVQICISLRRQDEFLSAMYYTTLMEEKQNLTPEEYRNGSIDSILDYHVVLSRWAAAFPDATLSVRIYEKGKSPHADSISDFLKVTNLDDKIGLPQRRVAAHRTLPARVTVALRTLMDAKLSPPEFFSIFTAAHHLYGNLREDTSLYAPSERRALIEQYRASNRNVRREFLDRLDQDLFAEAALGSDEDWAKRVGPHETAVARFLLDMSKAVNRRPV